MAVDVMVRPEPKQTLKKLRTDLDMKTETVVCKNTDIAVDLTKDNLIRFGAGPKAKKFEVESDRDSLTHLADFFGVPPKFLLRQDRDFQETIINGLISRNPGEVAIVWSEQRGLTEVRAPSMKVIDPRKIVDVAINVMSADSTVVEWWKNPREFRFDVIVPSNFDRGIGGDKPVGKKVGDLTRGGLRFGHDTQHNLAPWVQPYQYRLICTNGMETFDGGLKIDARGQSVEDVLKELEQAAEEAFSRVEGEIAAFYELRNHRVENPERRIVTLAEEYRLPVAVRDRLIEQAPGLGDDVSMFDVVNFITNQANDPTLAHRESIRRRFEQAGGAIVVAAEASRCDNCNRMLGAHRHN